MLFRSIYDGKANNCAFKGYLFFVETVQDKYRLIRGLDGRRVSRQSGVGGRFENPETNYAHLCGPGSFAVWINTFYACFSSLAEAEVGLVLHLCFGIPIPTLLQIIYGGRSWTETPLCVGCWML